MLPWRATKRWALHRSLVTSSAAPRAAVAAPSATRSATPSPSADAWETVIGLEVHAQIVSASKLFSGASTQFGQAPNSQCSFVDAAFPGMLPVLNRTCVEQAIRTGLALNGEIQRRSRFERKHYFYCDMPQGYQITQQAEPIVRHGSLPIDAFLTNSERKSVRIERIQIEQDSGKNIHDLHPQYTFVDLNRAGTGLMEIVTYPDIHSAHHAQAFIRALTSVLTSIGSCRGQMEDGSLRVDVNVSIRRRDGSQVGERVEVKNLNSLRSLVRAIDHEVERQRVIMEKGGTVSRETRSFDAKTGTTTLMRSKENMLDYRFAPEPDLPALVVHEQMIERIAATLPELPDAKAARLKQNYGLSDYDVGVLVAEPGAVRFFEELVHGPAGAPRSFTASSIVRAPKTCANWLMGDLMGRIKTARPRAVDGGAAEARSEVFASEDAHSLAASIGSGQRALTVADSRVTPLQIGSVIDLIDAGKISGKVGKQLLDMFMEGDMRSALQIVQDMGWEQVNDQAALAAICDQVLQTFAKEVSNYVKQPNKRVLGFLSGQVLKASSGKANPAQSAAMIRDRLEQLVASAGSVSSSKPSSSS